MYCIRRIDILIAIILLFPALITCIIVSFFVWMECRANPLFIQTRIGIHGKPFKLFKLRTMLPDTVDAASHHMSQSQIMRSGRFLRSTKLDELPQLINILNGTMSFVGPRPCLPSQTDLISERQKLGIFEVLPGITGVSQISGLDMSDPVALTISDARYVKDRSVRLYIWCLLATLLGKGSGDAVKNI